jgi:hypothetical protein
MATGPGDGGIEGAVGRAGRALAEGRPGEGADLLRQALAEALRTGHPRADDVARLAAEALVLAGRPAEGLEVLDGREPGTGRPGDDALRARALEALARWEEALSAWSAPGLQGGADSLDGRVRALLAMNRGPEALECLAESAVAARRAGDRAEALRRTSMEAPLLLEAGRGAEALARWQAVAAEAEDAGVPTLGVQAVAHGALLQVGDPAGRPERVAALERARGRAVELGDAAGYGLAGAALALTLAAEGRDAEAAEAALRSRAGLADLIGDTTIGDALVRRVAEAMGQGRWDRALEGFIAARKAGGTVPNG